MQAAACRDRVDQGLQLAGWGPFDQAVHQRCSVIHGVSQARIARSACGQDGSGGTGASSLPRPGSGHGAVLAGCAGFRRTSPVSPLSGTPGTSRTAERCHHTARPANR